jgi:Domain of unknown function (DUF4403)
MLKSFRIYSTFILFFSFLSCGTSQNQPQKPMETYQAAAAIPPSVSTVNIPVRMSVTQLERLLNNKMTGVIYEDNNLEDDGLMMKATKIQPIKMWLDGFQMGYRVPLKLWVFKKIIGNRGIEAEGEIALAFKTTLNINWDWSIDPKTELIGYEWIKNMAVKTGLGGIDVKYIANMIIERSKTTLTSSIDQQLKTQFQIRKNLEESWQMMQKPVPITSSYGTWWVKLTPQTVSMTPFKATSNDIIESVISATSFAEVVAGEKEPVFRPNSYLPNFALGMGNANDFIVNLTTDISFKEAEAMAKTFVKGQKFNPGGKEIEVTDIQLFGQNDKIVVNTTFKGSYSGSLYLVGRPVFNPVKNTIELEDLDYDLQSKSFLLKSAKWLFDKKILSKMKEACVFPLDDNVKFFKTMMNDQLQNYKFNNNVTLRGSVEDIKVDKISLIEGNIKVNVSSKGKLTLDVDGLDNF